MKGFPDTSVFIHQQDMTELPGKMREKNREIFTLSLTARPLAEALAVQRMLPRGPMVEGWGTVFHQGTFLKRQQLRTFDLSKY